MLRKTYKNVTQFGVKNVENEGRNSSDEISISGRKILTKKTNKRKEAHRDFLFVFVVSQMPQEENVS